MAAIPVAHTVDDLQTGAASTVPDPSYGGTHEARSWLDVVHPEFKQRRAAWAYAHDHYTAEVLDAAKLPHYLVRKAQGESEPGYKERLALADYTNHFAVVVDSLVGMVSAIEGDATRRFNADEQEGLGDPTDIDTVAGRLWRDADGQGSGWLTVWKQLGVMLSVLHRSWVLVDMVTGVPRVRILPPSAVPNWRHDASGRLLEALVVEHADTRGALQTQHRPTQDGGGVQRQFIHYTLGGWQRWQQLENGTAARLNRTGENDTGFYDYRDASGAPALPIFDVTLPLKRMVGYTLARKCNAIFNKESERDNLLRLTGFPKLNIVASREAFEQIVADLRIGSNVLHVPVGNQQHGYIAPPSEPAAIMTEVLKRKVEEFYVVAFREYGDAARERTATEVRQDTSAGVGAYLTLLSAALDNAERGAMWRIEQSVAPTDSSRHFVAQVERSLDFAPMDPDAVIDKQNARAFGNAAGVPLGFAAQRAAAKETLAHQGLIVDEPQVAEAVRARAVLEALTAFPDLPVPAEAKTALAMSVLVAAGYLPSEDTARGAGGEMNPPTLDRAAIEKASRLVAEAHEMFHIREAQALPGADDDEDAGGGRPPTRTPPPPAEDE